MTAHRSTEDTDTPRTVQQAAAILGTYREALIAAQIPDRLADRLVLLAAEDGFHAFNLDRLNDGQPEQTEAPSYFGGNTNAPHPRDLI